MNIVQEYKLSDLETYYNFLPKDENGREINIYQINECSCVSESTFYPNVIFKSNEFIFNPMEERTMSLDSIDNLYLIDTNNDISKVLEEPVFYFIYNTDNYYHFIYDSLPYLISYLELKKTIPDIKLLMNYPNSSMSEFYRFVKEFLEILQIEDSDIIIIDKSTQYKKLYISSSFTHGIDSNLPPRKEIKVLYQLIVQLVKENHQITNIPNKVYISRRTWLHNDFTNIGTNYTTRRRLENEDQLVEFLISQGYQEVFTENLSTIQKILMFSEVTHVVGSIGGGLVNVVFCKPETKLYSIISPTFLEINSRFKYCLDFVDVEYFTDTEHTESDYWKRYIRIKSGEVVGEIEDVKENSLIISYTDEVVSGWNNQLTYKRIEINKSDCQRLDNGLNSSWKMNLESFKKMLLSRKGILYFHQGYSDIINCLPLINYYSEIFLDLKVLIREEVKPMFDFYIRNLNNVSAVYVSKEVLDRSNPSSFASSEYETLFHGYHDVYRRDSMRGIFNRSIFYVEGFYKFYGIDYLEKVSKFNFLRDDKLEENFYNNFIKEHGSEYIIYHQDVSRNIEDYLPQDVKLVNLNGLTENLFESVKVLQNAKEIHLIDSIWSAFCYLLDHKFELLDNINVYVYPFLDRSGSNIENPTDTELKPLHKKNWHIK